MLVGDEPRLPLTMGEILVACSRPGFHVKHGRMPSGEGRVYIRLGPLTPWSIATASPFMVTNMSSARLHLLGYTTLWRHPGKLGVVQFLSMSPSGRQLKSECVNASKHRIASVSGTHRSLDIRAFDDNQNYACRYGESRSSLSNQAVSVTGVPGKRRTRWRVAATVMFCCG